MSKPMARAYDDKGNVRPADGRFLGAASDDVPPQDLETIRGLEIEAATARLVKQKEAEAAENQKRLDDAGYVNPTMPLKDLYAKAVAEDTTTRRNKR